VTITATVSEISYAGNGVTTVFAIPFAFDTSSDLKVLSTDSSGNVTELTTGWAASGGAGSTGTLTFTTAPAAGVTITILDDPDITQPTDYTNNDAFAAESHETALDRQTRISKRLYQIIKRCLRTEDGDPITGDSMVLGSVDNRKGKYLFFNAITGAIEYAVNLVTTTLSQSIIGALFYPQTTAESAALVTPVNYFYPPGNVLRYKSNTIPGTTDMTTAIQAALNSNQRIFIPDGNYLVTATLTFGDNQFIEFSNNAWLLAGVNSLTIFTVASHAYYSQVWHANLSGNGKTGVTGFDLSNVRLRAGIYNAQLTSMATGVIARTGCFGTQLLNLTTWLVPAPVVVLANGSTLQILKPTFDNSVGIGGTGLGIGVDIRAGASDNIGVQIIGGYIQGFGSGVKDAGIGTIVDGTYFELCTTADVEGATARQGRYREVQHYGPSGAAGYKLRNCDACVVFNPSMGSGARTALFDIDSSNTNVTWFNPGSNASLNSPTGTMTYVAEISREVSGTFTPVVVGTTIAGAAGAYSGQNGKVVKRGKQVHVEIDVAWTGHTGTGNIAINGIPTTLTGVGNELVPATYTRLGQVRIAGMAWTGPLLYATYSGVSGQVRPLQVTAAGVESLVPIAAAGTITINLVYEV
jgi:hypothetical protein